MAAKPGYDSVPKDQLMPSEYSVGTGNAMLVQTYTGSAAYQVPYGSSTMKAVSPN